MSSARLEVNNDDATIAPRMSRVLPAALYGIVNETAHQRFCDSLDELFDSLDAECRRRKKRFWYMYSSISIWYISVMFSIGAQLFDTVAIDLIAVVVCILHIGTIWKCTARPVGMKTDQETMRDVRMECDAMTNRCTPFVSFHVVLIPIPAAARGAWLQMNTIDHIAVSISALASVTTTSATAVAAAAAAMTSTIVDTDAVQDDTKVTDHHAPVVVFAQAVMNGNNNNNNNNYQKVATATTENSGDDEIV